MGLTCFKAYDIRGRVPDELNKELAYKIGAAYAALFKPETVVVGRDVRLESEELASALMNGLADSGVNVTDIGLCGTEEVYFATSFLKAGGGIMITASHNPVGYNGMKIVREGSVPVSGDSGLNDIKRMAEEGFDIPSGRKGAITERHSKEDYINFLTRYTEVSKLKKFRIVSNPGNGCAGPVIDLLEKNLPVEFVKIYSEPDGTFPNGVPNPLLPECRSATADAVIRHGADMGIAWDGDFDRCFFFDENGRFIEGYYIVGLLAEAMLAKFPGSKIIHDPRLMWNTEQIVKEAGGKPVMSKTGHAFIKERMRKEDAVYGGEMSAHHYFRDFAYCDSGMLPWLLVLSLMSASGRKLSELTDSMMKRFPVSGEINAAAADPDFVISEIEKIYAANALEKDYTDGVSMSFDMWRFNLRKSNTEPLIRLNVESDGDTGLMEGKRDELLDLIKGLCS